MKSFASLIKLLPTKPVFAHCDIPCGIYDPYPAQIAAHTVLRMTQLLNDLKVPMDDNTAEHEFTEHHNSVVRMVRVKEDHGQILEQELGTLLNDYFKPEHFEKFPDLMDLIHETVKLSAKARQTIDLEVCQKLLENTQKIAEIFWQTKGLEPLRVPSGYPTEGEIVIHK